MPLPEAQTYPWSWSCLKSLFSHQHRQLARLNFKASRMFEISSVSPCKITNQFICNMPKKHQYKCQDVSLDLFYPIISFKVVLYILNLNFNDKFLPSPPQNPLKKKKRTDIQILSLIFTSTVIIIVKSIWYISNRWMKLTNRLAVTCTPIFARDDGYKTLTISICNVCNTHLVNSIIAKMSICFTYFDNAGVYAATWYLTVEG